MSGGDKDKAERERPDSPRGDKGPHLDPGKARAFEDSFRDKIGKDRRDGPSPSPSPSPRDKDPVGKDPKDRR